MPYAWLLAWHHLRYNRRNTILLVAAIALVAYLPLAVNALVYYGQQTLLSRADTTPLVVGAPGSRFDLVLHALYFRASPPAPVSMADADAIDDTGWADAIPLYARFTARDFPVVGTSLGYFEFRGLEIADGKPMIRLGDCVLGAKAAEAIGAGPGDRLLSDPENVFDLAGTYPLNMRIMGVLAETDTADDYAVFVDVKTAWVIAGIGHGHQDIEAEEAPDSVVLERTEDEVVANAALPQYTEITNENIGSFHFHGAREDFPLTAILAVPNSEKESTLLQGRYEAPEAGRQILEPAMVVREMMALVFKAKRLFDANTAMVGAATALFLVLIVALSLRLRAAERALLFKLGCSRGTVFRLFTAELLFVFVLAMAVAAGLTAVTLAYAADLMRVWLA